MTNTKILKQLRKAIDKWVWKDDSPLEGLVEIEEIITDDVDPDRSIAGWNVVVLADTINSLIHNQNILIKVVKGLMNSL